jgi:hypothetical protein
MENERLGERRGENVSAKYCTRHGGQNFFKAGRKSSGSASLNFQAKMLKGDGRGAVKYFTEMEKGGVLLPDDVDETSGLIIK